MYDYDAPSPADTDSGDPTIPALLAQATHHAHNVLVHRMQCEHICSFTSTLLEHDHPPAQAINVLLTVHQCLQSWAQLDLVQSYLLSEQIVRDVDRVFEELRACGLRSKDAASTSLLEARRQDFVALRSVLLSIARNPDDVSRIASSSPDDIQLFMRSLQRAIKDHRAGEDANSQSELQDALLTLYKESNGKIPTPDLTAQIAEVSSEPVNPGGVTVVYRATWLQKEQVALKSLQRFLTDARIRKIFQQDVRSWHSFRHPNVLQFYGLCLDASRGCCLVTPWVEQGNILQYLDIRPDADVLRLIHDAACGLRHLHSSNPPIIHGDVRSANVMIKADGHACVSDFGLAEIIYTYDMLHHSRAYGPVRWQAPELVAVRTEERHLLPKYSKASDVYALGMTMFEVFTDRQPFEHIGDGSQQQLYQEILSGSRPTVPEDAESLAIQRGLSEDVWVLMECCWHQDSNTRPESQLVTRRLHAIIGKRRSAARARFDHLRQIEKASLSTKDSLMKTIESSDFSSSSIFYQRNGSFSSVSTGDSFPPSIAGSRGVPGKGDVSTPDITTSQIANRRLRGLRNSERAAGQEFDRLYPTRLPGSARRSARTSSPLAPPPKTTPISRFSFDSSLSEDSYDRNRQVPSLGSARVVSPSHSPKIGGSKDRFHVLVSKMTQASELRPDWVGVANMEELRAYAPFQLRQQSLIETLVKKESNFLSSSLDTAFSERLRSCSTILGEDVDAFVEDIFDGIRSLRILHRDFLRGLQARPTTAGGIPYVATLCMEVAHEFRSEYIAYNRNLSHVLHKLSELASQDSRFAALLEESMADASSMRSRLLSYLREPLTHLDEYPNILRAILKQGPAEFAGGSALKLACEEMARTVHQVKLASWQNGHIEASLDELLGPETLQSLNEKDVVYQQAIFSLISVERTCVKELRLIDNLLLQSLDSSESPIPKELSVALTEVYHKLLRVHQEIAENMYGVQQEQYPKLKTVVSRSGLSEVQWQGLYSDEYIQCIRQVTELVNKDANLVEQVNKTIAQNASEEASNGHNADLIAFLRAPALQLRAIVKALYNITDLQSETDEEQAAVMNLLSLLAPITQTCDDEISESRERAAFNRIIAGLTFTDFPGIETNLDLMSPNRQLILMGTFHVQGICADGELKEAFVILLDNYLLLTSISNRQGLDRYELLIKPIAVELLEVVNTQTRKTIMLRDVTMSAIVIRHCSWQQRTLSLCTEQRTICDHWMKTLQETAHKRIHDAETSKVFHCNLIHRLPTTPTCSITTVLNRETIRLFACDGLWIKRGDQNTYLALPLRGITSLGTMPNWDWILILAEQNIYAYRLDDLVPTNRAIPHKKIDDSKAVKFMRFGKLDNRAVLVIHLIRKGKNVLKVLEPLWKAKAGGRRPFKAKADIFSSRAELNFPHLVQDVAFLKSRLVVISNVSFHIVDVSQPNDVGSQLPLPGDPLTGLAERCKLSRPIGMHRSGDEFLLCYTGFGAYVNSGGRLTNRIIEWESTDTANVVFRSPWMFVIGTGLLEIRDLASGKLEQAVGMPDIKVTWDGPEDDSGSEVPDCRLHVSAEGKRGFDLLDQNDGQSSLYEVIMNKNMSQSRS